MNNFLIELGLYVGAGFLIGWLFGSFIRGNKEEKRAYEREIGYLNGAIAGLKKEIKELKGEKINPFLDENGNPFKQGKIEKG